MVTTTATAGSIRAANRERITAAILAGARAQLAEQGASAISLRAIARELGMSSSAIYRYFPSRDELLTVLIIDAYDSIGEAVERTESKIRRADITGRFRAICRGVRNWALEHEHEYFLIYGSPVPGYKAPTDTIAPATRVPRLLLTLLSEAAETTDPMPDPLPAAVASAIAPLRAELPPSVSDRQVVAALSMFSGLFGSVSFELNGQLHNVVKEGKSARNAYFDAMIEGWRSQVGL